MVALVLAGASMPLKTQKTILPAGFSANKALWLYRGRPLLYGVLEALLASQHIQAIVVVGDEDVRAALQTFQYSPSSLLPLVSLPSSPLPRSLTQAPLVKSATAENAIAENTMAQNSRAQNPTVQWVQAGATLPQSLQAGWNAAQPFLMQERHPQEPHQKSHQNPLREQRVVCVAADLPWLTAAAIDDLSAASVGYGGGYGVVARATYQQAFPHHSRTYATFPIHSVQANVTHATAARAMPLQVTGGNAVVMDPPTFAALLPYVARAYKYRKNPLALAGLVGPLAVVRYGCRKLTLSELEAHISRIVGVPICIHISPHAPLAADVDTVQHLKDGNSSGSHHTR